MMVAVMIALYNSEILNVKHPAARKSNFAKVLIDLQYRLIYNKTTAKKADG